MKSLDIFFIFSPLKKIISIFFLGLVVLAILPWQQIKFCVTHSVAYHHEHDNHNTPSLCDLRKTVTTSSFWPPMECFHIEVHTDNYVGIDLMVAAQKFSMFTLAFFHVLLLKFIGASVFTFNTHPPSVSHWSSLYFADNFSHRGPPLV